MKLAVLTTSRSDYGATKWLLKALQNDDYFDTRLIVSGNHYCKEFGNTYKIIEADGFIINHAIPLSLANDERRTKTLACAELTRSMGNIFSQYKPDLLCVLGDRFEILPVCLAAVLFNIPIAHISGGDITEGAIDDKIRHAITKLSNIHFPGNHHSAKILEQMGENPATIFNVGELGIESFINTLPLSRSKLAESLGLNEALNWILFTYHTETNSSLGTNLSNVKNILDFLLELEDCQVLMTYPNADIGHTEIISILESQTHIDSTKFHLIQNLGSDRFPSFLKESTFMIGNSSSAFFEAPSAKIPAINIGDRQKGRLIPNNIVTCDGKPASLRKAYKQVSSPDFLRNLQDSENPYGDGTAASKILRILKKLDLNTISTKRFQQIDNFN